MYIHLTNLKCWRAQNHITDNTTGSSNYAVGVVCGTVNIINRVGLL